MSPHPSTVARRHLLPNEARRLISPLSISLVLHALVFSQAPGVLPSPDSPASRHGNLRAKLQATPAATVPIAQPALSPTVQTEKAAMRQPEIRDYSPPVTRPAPEAVTERPTEQAPPEVRPNAPVEPMRTGVDVAGLRQYHLALGQQARQFRRYPEEAREAGLKGRITMRLSVSETGSPLGISLLGSSGFAILDRAALEMMLLSASHTEVPESLRGRSFSIDLAVDYNPEDAH
jgi:TonB family protein